MSTIASPRDTSVNGRRVPLISTPTSSSRPSLEHPRSTDASPSRAPSAPPKRNRAALREYYNLQKSSPSPSTEQPVKDDASSIISDSFSDVLDSELDVPSFSAPAYIKHVLETQSLGELLRTYNGVLTDIRALDAEKKALVYDNYSKLIAATETIRRMRENMGPLNPMAATLDPAIKRIYEMAEKVRGEMRVSGDEGTEGGLLSEEEREDERKREKARQVVLRVLGTPETIRGLVKDGKDDEARSLWEPTLKLLERWKDRGVGGPDVLDCIEDGEAALRGEPSSEKSWVNVKETRESTSS